MNPRSECGEVLIPTVDIKTMKLSEQLAWLSLVTAQDYARDQTRIEAEASYLGVAGGSGSYEDFNVRRRDFLSAAHFNYDRDESFNLFSTGLSKDQVAAWLGCIKTHDFSGPLLTAIDASSHDARVQLYYRPPPGAGGARRLDVRVEGGRLLSRASARLNGESGETWIISRTAPEDDLVVVANVYSGGAVSSDSLRIPAYRAPVAAPQQIALPWVYINPALNSLQKLGDTRSTESGFVVVAGRYSHWAASAGIWGEADRWGCVKIVARDSNDREVAHVTWGKPLIKVPSGCAVYIRVDDSTFEDNCSYLSDPLRARLVVTAGLQSMTHMTSADRRTLEALASE